GHFCISCSYEKCETASSVVKQKNTGRKMSANCPETEQLPKKRNRRSVQGKKKSRRIRCGGPFQR
ncbi:MAG: hypothetical protein J6S79_07995, partial [Lachnospiraceae bacterium]|nr:hypothetical protein [Lachnospiraceae bacterium]